jgi:hypothetical protein
MHQNLLDYFMIVYIVLKTIPPFIKFIRVGYVRFPGVSSTTKGIKKKLATAYARHMKFSALSVDTTRRYVAAHHWHPDVCKWFHSLPAGTKFPSLITNDLAKNTGLRSDKSRQGDREL